ncbi:MAG TPA: WXG100 family type VII secretion target [Pseudonocardiaceae bacterium]|nr:WXG100 family type VII secretion target [Pseudonocardiaceae bacterium]
MAGGSGFKTGSAELQKAGAQMQSTNEQLMSNMSKLANACQEIEPAWKGTAASAFQNLMTRFQEDAKNLNSSLDTISQSINANAANYAQQEQESTDAVNKITSTLGG